MQDCCGGQYYEDEEYCKRVTTMRPAEVERRVKGEAVQLNTRKISLQVQRFCKTHARRAKVVKELSGKVSES